MNPFVLAAWIFGIFVVMGGVCYLIDVLYRWLDQEVDPRG